MVNDMNVINRLQRTNKPIMVTLIAGEELPVYYTCTLTEGV
jgi:hypothetical protein